MNPLLSRLQPYPFERLRQLFAVNFPADIDAYIRFFVFFHLNNPI